MSTFILKGSPRGIGNASLFYSDLAKCLVCSDRESGGASFSNHFVVIQLRKKWYDSIIQGNVILQPRSTTKKTKKKSPSPWWLAITKFTSPYSVPSPGIHNFIWVISLNLPNSPMMVVIFILPISWMRKLKLRELILKVKKLERSRAKFETQSSSKASGLTSLLWTHSVSLWLCARITWWILILYLQH